MSITLLPLQEASPQVLAAVNTIYQEAFEEEEKVDFDGLVHWGTQPGSNYLPHFCAALENGEVIGMATYGYAIRERLGYLAYIAIRSDQRGRGLGEWLCRAALDSIEETARKMHSSAPLCTFWETRDPRDAPDEVELQHRLRRQRFYQKLGACTLPVAFPTPAVGEGLPDVAYQLMVYTYPPGRWLTRQQVGLVAFTGLTQFYGAPPESEYVAAMQASLETYPEQAG